MINENELFHVMQRYYNKEHVKTPVKCRKYEEKKINKS